MKSPRTRFPSPNGYRHDAGLDHIELKGGDFGDIDHARSMTTAVIDADIGVSPIVEVGDTDDGAKGQ